MGKYSWIFLVPGPKPTQRGILVKSLLPLYPFQQTMAQLVPYRTHALIPELVKVLNDAFDQRIQLTGQECDRLAPFVDRHVPELLPDGRLRCSAHECSR